MSVSYAPISMNLTGSITLPANTETTLGRDYWISENAGQDVYFPAGSDGLVFQDNCVMTFQVNLRASDFPLGENERLIVRLKNTPTGSLPAYTVMEKSFTAASILDVPIGIPPIVLQNDVKGSTGDMLTVTIESNTGGTYEFSSGESQWQLQWLSAIPGNSRHYFSESLGAPLQYSQVFPKVISYSVPANRTEITIPFTQDGTAGGKTRFPHKLYHSSAGIVLAGDGAASTLPIPVVKYISTSSNRSTATVYLTEANADYNVNLLSVGC